MTWPGETEAGSAGTQPCPGIARWKLIGDDERRAASTAPFFPSYIGSDRFPHALKIPARSAEYSVEKFGLTPIHAEPGQLNKVTSRSWANPSVNAGSQ